ncbi:uncharacterized protein LOC120335683 [Styela clava]
MSKIALVLGGAGNIGSASTKAFLESGGYKTVVITSRSQEKIDKVKEAIKASLGQDSSAKVLGVVGNVANEKASAELLDKVKSAVGDKVDVIISVMGFPYHNFGPLLHVNAEQINDVFGSQFFPAFGGYKTFFPLVKNSSSGAYVSVTGGGPDMYLGPGTAGMTLGGSLSTALAKVIMKEQAQDGVCISEVSFSCGVCPDPSVMPPGYNWLPSVDAGKALVSVATKKVAGGQTITIRTADDLSHVIANGALKQTNGVA